MQNLILNSPDRTVVNQAQKLQADKPSHTNKPSHANKSNHTNASAAFERLLNQQVSARQNANTKMAEKTQSSQVRPVNDKPNTATKLAKTEKPETEKPETKEPRNTSSTTESQTPVELMWSSVMNANALPNANALQNLVLNQSSGQTAEISADESLLQASDKNIYLTDRFSAHLTTKAGEANMNGQMPVLTEQILPIPADKLPTEQVRWLDLPASALAEQTNKNSGALQINAMPTDAMPSDVKPDVKQDDMKATDLRLTDAKSNLSLKDEINQEANKQDSAILLQQNAAINHPSLAKADAPQAASSHYIASPLGQTQWHQAISQKVMWMIGASEQTAVLTLNPPDLGPVQVVVSVNNDKADTTFISANADVRQALQDGLANLRDKLNESGLQLGQANINANMGGDANNQSAFLNGRQQQQSSQHAQAVTSLNAGNTADLLANQTTKDMRIKTSNGLVDTFV